MKALDNILLLISKQLTNIFEGLYLFEVELIYLKGIVMNVLIPCR